MYTIKRTDDITAVRKMHRLLFGKGTSLDGDTHWLVWCTGKTSPVGFCSIRTSTVKRWAFLARAGVLPEARGNNLQRRLLKVREQWARSKGLVGCLTYVANWNTPSLVNLLKSGYKIYDPANRRSGKWYPTKRDGFTYLSKRLESDSETPPGASE